MTCVFFFINSLDISGCHDVTVPVDKSNEEVTERLREKNKKQRIYHRRINCSSKIYQTTLYGNRIEKEEVEISGRIIDVTYIRKKLLEKNKKFMRKRSDEVLDNMDRESITENLQKLKEVQSSGLDLETNSLQNKVSLWIGPGI